ncbi:MAG TPA: SRPBCC family protein [Acidimicrobiia bacterium]|jgi:carbon monoxide dehydrogenase subunit G|nr:SRPBCC family protein [Acidimicrobiia bacterium]
MELEVHRHERIMAPLQLVWEEMDSLEQILAKTPQISDYDVVPGGQKAGGKAKLAWGPVKWMIDLEVEIVEFQPRQRIAYTVDGPALEVHYRATIELATVGDNETKLDLRGHFDVRHRMASRMRGLFNEILEDQAHSLVHRVKVKAEQRRLAQERLLK